MTADDVRRDSDDRPVDRRVDARARTCADVERGRRAAVELIPDRVSAAAAEDLVEHALKRSLVALVSEWSERHCAVRRGVDGHLPGFVEQRDLAAVGTQPGEGRHDLERSQPAAGAAEGVMEDEPTVLPRDFDVIEVPFAERGEPKLIRRGARPSRGAREPGSHDESGSSG